jgi:hypothetical protein
MLIGNVSMVGMKVMVACGVMSSIAGSYDCTVMVHSKLGSLLDNLNVAAE